MLKTLILLTFFLVAPPQSEKRYPPTEENELLKFESGQKFFEDDETCGDYFIKSEKALKQGTAVYYLYGNPEFGKKKVGLYLQSIYEIIIDNSLRVPKARLVFENSPKETQGKKSNKVVVKISNEELKRSSKCFPEPK